MLKRSDIPYGKPNLSGAPTLDIKRLAERVKDYFLGEYQIKFRYSNSRFFNGKSSYTTNLRPKDFTDSHSGDIYYFSDRLTKTKQDYMRSVLGDSYKTVLFVKKERPFKLRSKDQIDYNTYYSLLNLENYPKSKWRGLIKEFRYLISLYEKEMIDCDAIQIPQEWIDAQKAKRMKILVKPVTVKGEIGRAHV